MTPSKGVITTHVLMPSLKEDDNLRYGDLLICILSSRIFLVIRILHKVKRISLKNWKMYQYYQVSNVGIWWYFDLIFGTNSLSFIHNFEIVHTVFAEFAFLLLAAFWSSPLWLEWESKCWSERGEMKTLLYWGRAVTYIMSQTRIANDNVKRKNIGSNLKLTTSTITTNVTNIQIRLLVEDIQQLRRKRKKNIKKKRKKF